VKFTQVSRTTFICQDFARMRVTGELAGAGWLSQGILASGYDGIPVLLPL